MSGPPRKYMIRCDMEGASGVVSYDQVVPGAPGYAGGCALFMSDLLAAVEGLLEGGADDVWVYDEHFDGRNVDLHRLPDRCRLVAGKPPYEKDDPGGLDGSFAGMLLVGLHAMAGTDELLHHTYEPDIAAIDINGRRVGEIGTEAAVAADFGVPLVMITGDSAAIREAEDLVPGVAGVAVKESRGPTGGVCKPLSVTAAEIRSAARAVAAAPAGVAPFDYGSDATLRITLHPGPYVDAVRELYGTGMADDSTLVVERASVAHAWADYWQMKLACQRRVCEQA